MCAAQRFVNHPVGHAQLGQVLRGQTQRFGAVGLTGGGFLLVFP